MCPSVGSFSLSNPFLLDQTGPRVTMEPKTHGMQWELHKFENNFRCAVNSKHMDFISYPVVKKSFGQIFWDIGNNLPHSMNTELYFNSSAQGL